MTEGDSHLENSKLIDADTKMNHLNTLALDTNTDSLHTYVKDTDTDICKSLAKNTNIDNLETQANDTNTYANIDSLDRKVQFSHMTTNTNDEVLATTEIQHLKSIDVEIDNKDFTMTTISSEDDDHSDTKSLHSAKSHLDEEFYDPVRNGSETKQNLNLEQCVLQDSPQIENVENKSKFLENKNIEGMSKSLKPTLSRYERSSSSFSQNIIKKNPSKKMINRIKKNVKYESNKKNTLSPRKLANGLLIDSHIKTHQKNEREVQKKFVNESWKASLLKKDNVDFTQIQSNASNEHCELHGFNKALDAFQKKKVMNNKIKNTSVPNFQFKLSVEHCKSHEFDSPKFKDETQEVIGSSNFHSKLSKNTSKSQSPSTKTMPILKFNKIKIKIGKRIFNQVNSTPPSKSLQSTPLESPQTPQYLRDRDSTLSNTRYYINPKGLKPIKTCFYKPNAEHPQPWSMPSPNTHYDDIEVDSLPTIPRYCSCDKKPLQQHSQKYSPRRKSSSKPNNSTSQSCFGLPCGDVPKRKETNNRTIIEHKKIAHFIVQDLPPLKLSRKSKSPHWSPIPFSPFTIPRKINTIPPTLINDEPQQIQLKLNPVLETKNLDDNNPPTDSTSFVDTNEETTEGIISKDTTSKHIEASQRLTCPHSKFWKSQKTKAKSKPNPYACEYHDYSSEKLGQIPSPILINRSTLQIENSNKDKKIKCNCCGRKKTRKKIKRGLEKNIADDNKEETVTILEDEKNITKIIKENGIKFNAVATGENQGSKVLHKIKVLILRNKTSSQKGNSKDLQDNQNKIHNEDNKSSRCFGGSKSKVSKLKSKSKVDDKIPSPLESSNTCKIDDISISNPSKEEVESNASTSSIEDSKNKK